MLRFATLALYLKVVESTVSNPYRLEDISIETVKNTIEDQLVRILERIHPNIFYNKQSLTRSGFMNVFLNNSIPLKSVDLSAMNLKRIPSSIVDRITGLEILDLSNNPDIKLIGEWFERLIENNRIHELSLSSCRITSDDLEVIDRIETLERLNISGNRLMNIKTESFKRILKRLKHLDISQCCLNSDSLQFIFENAVNLTSLDYSWNSITEPFRYLNVNTRVRKNLEALNLSYCSLISDDLEHVFVFENLKEIDLSGNSFSFIKPHSVRRIFFEKVRSGFDNTIDNFFENGYCLLKGMIFKNNNTAEYQQDIYLENLESINLENCRIESPEFIKNIFDLQKLESLNLNGNLVSLELVKITNCNSLKKLEMRRCKFFDERAFRLLTELRCLEYLDISENFFEIMDENFTLGNLTRSLKYLNIKNSGWNANALKAILECQNLQYLDASENDFNSTSLDFKDLINTLIEVSFGNCNVNFRFLEKLTECRAIEKLVLSRNIIADISEGFTLKNLENTLVSLDIDHCEWNTNGLKALSKCSKLRYLNASHNRFSNIESKFNPFSCSLREIDFSFSQLNHNGLAMLAQCTHLKKLNVSGNAFEDLPSSFSLNLLRNSLEELIINNCGLKGSHLRAITDCRRLKILNASNNNFYDLTTSFKLGISKDFLESLLLNGCGLDHSTLRAVTDCRKLEKLDISNNNYEDINETAELGCSRRSLIELFVNSCLVNYTGFSLITECSRLEKLFAAHNDFTVPDNFTFGCSKKTLTDLDLSWCNLNGDGLKAVFECSKLKRLTAKGSIVDTIPRRLNLGLIRYSLRSIDLRFSKLDYDILDLFNECSMLMSLDLKNCEIKRSRSIFEKLKRMIIAEVSDYSD